MVIQPDHQVTTEIVVAGTALARSSGARAAGSPVIPDGHNGRRGLDAEYWLRQMFEASPVAQALADEHGALVMANDAYCTLVGRDRDDLLGRTSKEFTHPDDLAEHVAMESLMERAKAEGTALRVEKRYLRPDGEVRWGWLSVAHVDGPDGTTWTMTIVHDSTERRQVEDALQTEATTDALTGLLNRRGWRRRLYQMVIGWNRVEPVALAMIDIDHFKRFNDTHGHPAGDDLLRDFATRARAALRDDDLLARWGGEEFALALPGCDRDEARLVLSQVAALVPAEQTFSAGYDTMRAGETLNQCLERIDDFLYEAKRDGRNRLTTALEPEPLYASPPLRPGGRHRRR